MKELYTSPEMKILCFAPVERLANSDITMDELLGNLGGSTNPASNNGLDVNVDITLN